jgi:hypothetical protein
MRKIAIPLTLLGAVFVVLPVAPAQAQATRTWVSGVGDDANPCSRTAPCKTFAGAISKTAASGEINCLDPGGFGGVTITKNLTIACQYTEGGILASLTNGVNINGANIIVVLSGLDIEGAGNGLIGINILQGATVLIEDSRIQGFRGGSQVGVFVKPSGANPTKVTMNRVTVANNGNGVFIDSTAGTGLINVAINDSTMHGNTNSGIELNSTATEIRAMVNRTVSVNNFNGLKATGTLSKAHIANSTFSNNTGSGLITANSGQIISIRSNAVKGNGTDGAPTSTFEPI